MQHILITGASGNIGRAIQAHFTPSTQQTLWLATRNKSAQTPERYFDFDDLEGSKEAIKNTDVLFLLRPPHIANVPKYFAPLIHLCRQEKVKHIIFLSVQGAENSSFIPHARIEKLIVQSLIPYTFIRPSYFMQNLTTTLLRDIKNRHELYVPAGTAPFLWVDAEDVGRAIAAVLQNTAAHQNKAYTITGTDLVPFGTVAAFLSKALPFKVAYKNPGLISFFRRRKKEGLPSAFIWVMLALHFLPRFQAPPKISAHYTALTGLSPKRLEEFIAEHRSEWQ